MKVRDSNDASFYIRYLCFTFVYSVRNLLTVPFVFTDSGPFSSRSLEWMNELRLAECQVLGMQRARALTKRDDFLYDEPCRFGPTYFL